MKWKFFLFIISTAILWGCAGQSNLGEDEEQINTQKKVYKKAYDQVYEAVIQVVSEKEWVITFSEKEMGIVQIQTSNSTSQKSDKVRITINQIGKKVEVKASIKQGDNVENISDFFNTLDNTI